ncbi:MAG: N-acetylglucosaminyldiphosphoundecaprenol N-acetyl-beta-D-mannosaminyltransferase [Flavobacteriales bacterium]|jgi:N-acetylglucosaminyldiphosphoundecaprenol N-acetyl-beta-D-mannosaminyltransferase
MNLTPYYHLKLSNVDTCEILEYVEALLQTDRAQLETLYFLNAHCFNISLKNTAYKNALLNSSHLLNDGIGIKIGAKRKSIELKENMNGTDLIPKLLSSCANANKKAFLLGASDDVILKAREHFQLQNPSLDIAGTHSGFFDDDQRICAMINNSQADFLVIGMGVPRQELWLEENKHRLSTIKLAVAGGAIFDFSAGEVSRAPQWVQSMGLEWLYRFTQEPQRLFKRYFIGNIAFLLHIYRH